MKSKADPNKPAEGECMFVYVFHKKLRTLLFTDFKLRLTWSRGMSKKAGEITLLKDFALFKSSPAAAKRCKSAAMLSRDLRVSCTE